MSFKPTTKAGKAMMMTDEEAKALQVQFARDLKEWEVKRAELQAEAERNNQHLDWKVTTKSIRSDDREIVYEQRISYSLKPLSKRAQKANAQFAVLQEQRGQFSSQALLSPAQRAAIRELARRELEKRKREAE